jgi:hypothetical protein
MPNGANCQTAPPAKRRQLPDGANCPTAPTARRRQLPNFAFQTTQAVNSDRRFMPAQFEERRSAFRAVRHFAPFGSSRR